MLIGNGQRIAVDTIAGPEVALEVRGPEVIGPGRRRGHDAGVGVVTPTAMLLDQPPSGQEVAGRARGRHLQLGLSPLQPVQDLLGAPARMLPPPGADRRRDIGRDPVRAMMRRPAPLAQSIRAFALVALDPLVAGLPADPVAFAQLHHRIQVALPVRDEPHALFHGCCLRPRHAHLP